MILTTYICDGENCNQKLIVLGCENLTSIFRVYEWHEVIAEYPDIKHYCPQCWPKIAAGIDETGRMNDL
jgi:hypothetical protein